jgi:uncharacterized protein YndB with AHSA1/START domain
MMQRDNIRKLAHETLVFTRRINVAQDRVFDAFADVKKREQWSAPSDSAAVVYSEADFRANGRDVFRCGDKGDLRYLGVVHYVEIVKDQRIVFFESISSDGQALGASLVSWELRKDGGGTLINITDQVTAFDGADMVSGTRMGMNAALDNFCRALDPKWTG